MYRDLFDKYKTRAAFISEDYKWLIINYEFRSGAISFNKERVIEKEYDCFGGKAGIKLSNNKEFIFELELKEPDLNFLYKVSLAVAYIVGKDLHLRYYYENFPYYPTDRYFNMNTFSPVSKQLFKNFIENPEEILSKIITRIENRNSYFNKFLPTLLNVNTFSYPDIVFIIELGLLEKEASKNIKGIESKVFVRNSKEFKELESFLSDINKKLKNEYPNIDKEVLRNKLSIENINKKGVTKEKMKTFLSSFSREDISECSEYVGTWWEMRNGIIVHGTTSEGLKIFNKNKHLADRLHRLLVDFLMLEYSRMLS
ncbi:MAG: hypothetical protein ACTSRA_18075 [Promethearchaeota archaeon]